MAKTPICPIMSSGQDIPKVCAEEECSWFIKNYKTCSIYILAHNAALDIAKKQNGESKQ